MINRKKTSRLIYKNIEVGLGIPLKVLVGKPKSKNPQLQHRNIHLIQEKK